MPIGEIRVSKGALHENECKVRKTVYFELSCKETVGNVGRNQIKGYLSAKLPIVKKDCFIIFLG